MHRESAIYLLNLVAIRVYQALNHRDGPLYLLILVRKIRDAYSWNVAQNEPALYEALRQGETSHATLEIEPQ